MKPWIEIFRFLFHVSLISRCRLWPRSCFPIFVLPSTAVSWFKSHFPPSLSKNASIINSLIPPPSPTLGNFHHSGKCLDFRQARNDQHSTSRFSFSMVTMASFRYLGFNLQPLPGFFSYVLRRRELRKVWSFKHVLFPFSFLFLFYSLLSASKRDSGRRMDDGMG